MSRASGPRMVGSDIAADSGIAYFGTAGGSASGNEVYGNQAYGIYVESTANPVLQNNSAHDNLTADVLDNRK